MTQLALCNTLGASRAPTKLAARVAAILRRRGGTLIGIPDNALGDGAPNLLSSPEFVNGVNDAPTRSGLITSSSMTGYDGAVAFGHDGSTTSYLLKAPSHTNGLMYTLSVIVEMSDGLAPTFGHGIMSDPANTFAVVLFNLSNDPRAYTVTPLGGAMYRVSASIVSSGAAAHAGVYKYATNNNRTFKVTGYKLELGSVATAYTTQAVLRQRGTYQDTTGTMALSAVAEVLGLMTDRLGVLGPNLAGLSTPWQSYGTGISLSGGQMVFTASPAGQFAMRGAPLAANKTYEVEINVAAISGGGLQMLVSGGAGTAPITTPGTYRGIYKSMGADGPYLCVASGTVTAVVIVASCKERTGNHATQPTPANKPTLVRVPKRLGPNLVVNGGFDTDTSSWLSAGGVHSWSAGTLRRATAQGDAGSYQDISGFVVGKTYRLGAQMSNITLVNGVAVYAYVGPGFGAVLGSVLGSTQSPLVFTATSAVVRVYLYTNSTSAADFDNIEVREVLEWTNAISLDGANDFLTIGPSTFTAGTLTSNMDVTMSITRKKSGVIILAHDANSAGSRFIGAAKAEALSAVNNVGTAWSIAVNGILLGAVNSVTRAQLDTAMPVGVPCTVEFRNLDLSAWTNSQVGNFASWELGAELGAIAISTAATDSERDLIRKWMASTNRAPYWGELPTLSLDFVSGVYVVSNGEI